MAVQKKKQEQVKRVCKKCKVEMVRVLSGGFNRKTRLIWRCSCPSGSDIPVE